MATEIATRAETASLPLVLNDVRTILTAFTDERTLTEDEFATLAAFAAAPPPEARMATDEDFKALIGSMAGVLKMPKTSVDEGRLKLSIYSRMLGHLPLSTLQWITREAIRTMEWMPTPAQLLELAKRHAPEERLLHTRATAMVRKRTQRIADELIRSAARKELSHDQLQGLPAIATASLEALGIIHTRLDGTREYRTPENVKAHLEEVSARYPALAAPDERDNRAGAEVEP